MSCDRHIKVLFVLARVLGGKTFANHVISAIRGLDYISPSFVFWDDSDYIPYPARNFYKNKFLPAHRIREKVSSISQSDIDVIFISGFEFISRLYEWISRYPTILALDSTNISSYRLLSNQNSSAISTIGYFCKRLLTKPLYSSVVKKIDCFLPRTSWCADSLVRDYSVERDKIIVAPGGIDTDTWTPSINKTNGMPSLLLVANDLKRKGGLFLLDVYRKHLSNKCKLTIASNDSTLDASILPDGVDIIHGLNHSNQARLVSLYQSSDLFVYPTRKDQGGRVLLEAAATGLPIIPMDVGGISEIVRHGINGVLMPYNSSVDT